MMKVHNGRRNMLRAAAAIGVSYLQGGQPAWSQNYPARPVTMIVPFPPGGGTDFVARAFAPRLAAKLGQNIVVENRGGAAGNIGAAAAARAPADGYTLLFTAQSPITISAFLKPPPSYNAQKDFVPIAIAARSRAMVVVNSSVPVSNLAELARYTKENPGKVFYGSAGTGNETHLLAELVKREAGISMTHVPYKGSGPALNDLLGGLVQVMIGTPGSFRGHLESGRLKGIAVLSSQRMPEFPNVPSAAEGGWSKLTQLDFWFGLFAPVGVPPAVAQTLSTAMTALARDENYKAELRQATLEAELVDQAEFAKVISRGRHTWNELFTADPALAD